MGAAMVEAAIRAEGDPNQKLTSHYLCSGFGGQVSLLVVAGTAPFLTPATQPYKASALSEPPVGQTGITPSKKCSSAPLPEVRCHVHTVVGPGTPRV